MLRLTPIALALSLISMPHLAMSQEKPAGSGSELQTLKTVDVTAQSDSTWDIPPPFAGGQVATGARVGALGNESVMDVPMSVISYTEELMLNQQANTIGDVLANNPSVRNSVGGGHLVQNFRIRGFEVNAGDLAINGLFGLAPRNTATTQFFERVEVLSGPTTLYSGMAPNGATGGVINLVPKRAGDEPLNRVTVGYESTSYLSTAIDVGRRFGENNEWGIRINALYGEGGTTVNNQTMRNEQTSLALDYRGTQLKASLDAYYTNQLATGGLAASAVGVPGSPGGPSASPAATAVPPAPNARTNMFPNATGSSQTWATIGRAEYAFDDVFTAFGSVGYSQQDQYGFINGTHIFNLLQNGSASLRPNTGHSYLDSLSADAGVRARFSTWDVGHNLVVQLTDLEQTAGTATNFYCSNNGSSAASCNPSTAAFQTTNINNPASLKYPSMPGYIPRTSKNILSSAALIDTLSFWEDSVLLTVGGRQQRVQTFNYTTVNNQTTSTNGGSYDQSRLSPTAGLVVKPWGPSISLYANYSEGLSTGGIAPSTAANAYQAFAPIVTKQEEVGVKWNTGSLMNSLALFNINQPSMVTSSNNYYTDGGNKRVRGVEWETSGEVVKNVRVLGGVTYMNGVMTQNPANVALNGKKAIGVPDWQANIGSEWDMPWLLKGLTSTARVNATSRQWMNSANTQELAGWTTLDLGARYATAIQGKNTTFRVNVNNLFDKNYYSGVFGDGYATVGTPMTVLGSVTVDF